MTTLWRHNYAAAVQLMAEGHRTAAAIEEWVTSIGQDLQRLGINHGEPSPVVARALQHAVQRVKHTDQTDESLQSHVNNLQAIRVIKHRRATEIQELLEEQSRQDLLELPEEAQTSTMLENFFGKYPEVLTRFIEQSDWLVRLRDSELAKRWGALDNKVRQIVQSRASDHERIFEGIQAFMKAKMDEELEQIRQDLNSTLVQEAHSRETRYGELLEKSKDFLATTAEQERVIERLRARCQELETVNLKGEKDLESARQNFNDMGQRFTDANEKLEEYNGKFEEANGKLADVNAKLDRATQLANASKAEANLLAKRIAFVQPGEEFNIREKIEAYETLVIAKNQMKHDLDQKSKAYDELSGDKGRLEEELKLKTEALTELSASKDQMQKALEQKEDAYTELLETKNQIEEEFTQKSKAYTELSASNGETRKALEQKTLEVDLAVAAVEEAKRKELEATNIFKSKLDTANEAVRVEREAKDKLSNQYNAVVYLIQRSYHVPEEIDLESKLRSWLELFGIARQNTGVAVSSPVLQHLSLPHLRAQPSNVGDTMNVYMMAICGSLMKYDSSFYPRSASAADALAELPWICLIVESLMEQISDALDKTSFLRAALTLYLTIRILQLMRLEPVAMRYKDFVGSFLMRFSARDAHHIRHSQVSLSRVVLDGDFDIG